MNRKRKLRLIQISLLILGSLVILITFYYYNLKNKSKEKIISVETQKNLKNDSNKDGDIFYNIEYSGLDLSGNRYLLKSKEATIDPNIQEIVNMTSVEAFFFFKDNTVLNIQSELGVYNNRTLDMTFLNNVTGLYEDSELYSQKAEYSNSKNFLIISQNVKVINTRGTMTADKLFFDIKEKKLNITSFNNGKINTNLKLK